MNDTPEISFERSLTRSLMLLHHCSLPEDSFESKMLRLTRIPGTLPLSTRSDPEDPMLVYDITSLLSVEKHYENRRIVWQDIAVLIDSLSKLLRQLEAYLLPESYLSLDPRTLFLDPEKKLLLFALASDASPDFQSALTRLLAWVLERIDYSSDATVVLAYRLHKESCREYCSIADLQKLVRIHTEKTRQQTATDGQKADTADNAQPSNASAAKPGLSPDGIFRYQPEGNTVLPQSPQPITETHIRETAPLAPKSNRPSPPPILGDDWAEDDDADPNYSFPASRSAHELNPEDYAMDMTAESDGNASGNLFSFLRLKKDRKKEKAASLKAKLQTKRSENSFKARLLLCLLLMPAIPTLIFLLKGPSLFRRLLPVILILEIGIAVLTALDFLMLRMPEEEA